MKKFFLLICLFCSIFSLRAQVQSSGKDFWFSYMENRPGDFQIETLKAFISSSTQSSGYIENPSLNWRREFNIAAGETYEVQVPSAVGEITGFENALRKGIHIVSSSPVSVYVMNLKQGSADAAMILPTIALGKRYRVISHFEEDQKDNPDAAFSQMVITGIKDNTKIEITPSVDLVSGRLAGEPFTIVVRRGEATPINAQADLSGTLVRSIPNDEGECFEFALFAGHQATKLGECGAPQHLYEQMWPISTWGKRFAAIPLVKRPDGSFYKIMASEPNTKITIGQESFTLSEAGEVLDLEVSIAKFIEADKPVLVAQLNGCDGTASDPFMVLIPPVTQLLNRIAFPALAFSEEAFQITIVSPSSGVSSLRIDGDDVSPAFSTVPGQTEFSSAQLSLIKGNHLITSQQGFYAYTYNFAGSGSLAYPIGLGANNQIANIDIEIDGKINPATNCKDYPAKLSYTADNTYSIAEWILPDGSIQLGQTIDFTFTEVGDQTVRLILKENNSSCAEVEEIKRIFEVVGPDFNILGPASVCPGVKGVIYDTDPVDDYNYQWSIDGGLILQAENLDSIEVDWSIQPGMGWIETTAIDDNACVSLPVRVDVEITNDLNPGPAVGKQFFCAGSVSSTEPYWLTSSVDKSSYDWQVIGGIIIPTSQPDSILVQWSPGDEHEVWYEERSKDNANCRGVSEILSIVELDEIDPRADITEVTCLWDPNGRIELNTIGGIGPPYSYYWDNNTEERDRKRLDEGIYNVIITDTANCSKGIDFEILISQTPFNPVLESNNILCAGETTGEAIMTITGGVPPYLYNWTDESSGSSINNLSAGRYAVTVSDEGECRAVRYASIGEPPKIEAESFSENVVCIGSKSGLAGVVVSGGVRPYTYQWETSLNQTSVANDLYAGMQKVVIKDANQCAKVVEIDVKEENPIAHFPSAFSPNRDGKNDFLRPEYPCAGEVDLKIFNRWGTLVFTSTNPVIGWEGDYEGKKCQEGVYVYKLRYLPKVENAEWLEQTGTVILMR